MQRPTVSCITAVCSLLQTEASAGGSEDSEGSAEDQSGGEESSDSSESENEDDNKNKEEEQKEEEEEEESEPLSLEWPETRSKQATYLFLLPIVFPLWLTLPDVRNLVPATSSPWQPHIHEPLYKLSHQ